LRSAAILVVTASTTKPMSVAKKTMPTHATNMAVSRGASALGATLACVPGSDMISHALHTPCTKSPACSTALLPPPPPPPPRPAAADCSASAYAAPNTVHSSRQSSSRKAACARREAMTCSSIQYPTAWRQPRPGAPLPVPSPVSACQSGACPGACEVRRLADLSIASG
jgi:hypothetical protein